LTEDSPLRANPDFAYAQHTHEVERWLDRWLPEHPDLDVAVLRLGLVAGPDVDNFIVRAMTETVRPMIVKGYRPPVQFAHVEDVADAIEHAVLRGLDGRFNVACEGWLSFEEAAGLLGQRSLTEVPEAVAFSVAERLWSRGLALFPPGALHYFMHPFVMSVDRIAETGWRPQHTNRFAATRQSRLAAIRQRSALVTGSDPFADVRCRTWKTGEPQRGLTPFTRSIPTV
ncbi:MAG: hypothetical protein KY476_18600, partial [Planctomycetes bacterium]|nr:hypothetical protein [Planctomycetota bacterium]